MIQEIGSWVLRTACRQTAKWREAGLIPDQAKFSVSVNLSGRQLDGPNSAGRILAVIEEFGVRPATSPWS